MEVQLVLLVELQARMSVGVDQRRIDVDEVVVRRGGAVRAHQRVVVVHVFPLRDAVGGTRGGDIDDACLRRPAPDALGELPETGEDQRRRVGVLGVEVVAAAVVDDDPRRVARHELIEARELVAGARPAEGPIEHGQRRHLFGHGRPLPEDAAADEEDAALGKGLGGILLGEGLEGGLVLRPTLGRLIGGVNGRQPEQQEDGEETEVFHATRKRRRN